MRAIAASFGRAHEPRSEAVELSFFPDNHYIERLSIAAAARDLPDAFELDGPLVARFVDARLLMPLEPFFSELDLQDFLPSIRTQGSIDGRLYALGAFESAAVLYLDRERLAAAGATLPPGGGGPPWVEFINACERLTASGIRAVALHMDRQRRRVVHVRLQPPDLVWWWAPHRIRRGRESEVCSRVPRTSPVCAPGRDCSNGVSRATLRSIPIRSVGERSPWTGVATGWPAGTSPVRGERSMSRACLASASPRRPVAAIAGRFRAEPSMASSRGGGCAGSPTARPAFGRWLRPTAQCPLAAPPSRHFRNTGTCPTRCFETARDERASATPYTVLWHLDP